MRRICLHPRLAPYRSWRAGALKCYLAYASVSRHANCCSTRARPNLIRPGGGTCQIESQADERFRDCRCSDCRCSERSCGVPALVGIGRCGSPPAPATTAAVPALPRNDGGEGPEGNERGAEMASICGLSFAVSWLPAAAPETRSPTPRVGCLASTLIGLPNRTSQRHKVGKSGRFPKSAKSRSPA